MNTMNRDFAAFRARLLAGATVLALYELRDAPTIQSVAESIDKIATAFDEYKKTNDQRLDALKAGKGTADLDAKLERIDTEITALGEQKSRLEKLEAKLARPGVLADAKKDGESKEQAEYRNAFVSWVRNPKDHDGQQRCSAAQKALDEQRRLELRSAGMEHRAAQVITSTGSAGGFALPEVIERTIAKIGLDISPIRRIAKVRRSSSPDYQVLIGINGAAFEWLGETDTRNQTNTSDLAEVAPTFGMASAKPQATEESLDDLFFDVEAWLVEEAADAIAQGEGAAFVSGNGTKKPTGFLAGPTPVTTTDASRAFGTLQYVASGQAAAMPTSADIFLDVVYALRSRYRRDARWVTNKLVLAAMRKYKDSQNQYLWQPSLAAGQPSTFLGYGVEEAEDMPAVGAGAFPIAFGDFSEGYLIADLVGMRMTRDEITTPGFVKFYVRKRVGGKLRNTQAIKLLKIAAA